MPLYEHECHTCGLVWFDDYGLTDPKPEACPECTSHDIIRCVGSSGFILKGSGWASDGYYKNQALDYYGNRIKLYDNKEDYVREANGEAKEREKRKLIKQNESIKRTLGYDSKITEKEAERKIQKAGDKAKGEI